MHEREIVVPAEFQYLYQRTADRPVVKIPMPVLRQEAGEVKKFDRRLDQLVSRLFAIMKEANGIGLAAPQIGILQRVFVISPDGVKPTVLINPVITKREGTHTGQEGCLSIPGLYGDVTRPEAVEVEAYDRKGRQLIFELEGMPAKVVQHELDHLNGVLFIDTADTPTLHWSHPDGEPPAD